MPAKLIIHDPIVSVQWLWQHFNAPNLIVLDASMKKATSKEDKPNSSLRYQIKNTQFLDIKSKFSESSAEFPNTMLSPDKFSEAARQLGINNDSAIVVYDDLGVYSSPRVWWMFKAMGHQNIAVLNGGLPEWKKKGFPVEGVKEFFVKSGNFSANYDEHFLNNYQEVLDAIDKQKILVIDARSENRFNGVEKEPRKGLRSGHIPGSKNLPYSKILDGYTMKSKEELSRIYSKLVSKDDTLIFSCGSGITACILALGAEIVGLEKKSVYDGSWTEWGSRTELPVEK